MKYSEQEDVEAGLKFKTLSGIVVETTGTTVFVESTDVFVHEVEILEGVGQGNRYLHNLNSASKVD